MNNITKINRQELPDLLHIITIKVNSNITESCCKVLEIDAVDPELALIIAQSSKVIGHPLLWEQWTHPTQELLDTHIDRELDNYQFAVESNGVITLDNFNIE